MDMKVRVLDEDLLNNEGYYISAHSDSSINEMAEKISLSEDTYNLNRLSLTILDDKGLFTEAFVEYAIFRGNETFRFFKKRIL